MATGGHQSPSKDTLNPDSGNNSSFNDRLIQWSLLPNNLELNLRSKNSKKQRNKDKSKTSQISENFSSVPQCASNKYLDPCLQPISPISHSTNVKKNIKVPVNQRSQAACFQTPILSMENENIASKEECNKKQPDAAIINERLAHLKDCILQVNSVLQHLEQSDEPQIMEQILTMKGIREDLLQKESLLQNFVNRSTKDEPGKLQDMKQKLTQDERTQKLLLQQILHSSDEVDQNPRPSYCPPNVEDIKRAERNGGVSRYYSDDDKANLQSHLLETMKASQEKLSALSHQKSLLLSMHKKPDDKQKTLPGGTVADSMQREQDWFRMPAAHQQADADKVTINGDICWEKGATSEALRHVVNADKASKDNACQDLAKLHVNMEHIKRRVELLQQMSDNGNVDITYPQDLSLEDNPGERANMIEWQRKKLKNSLLELEEKKKASEEIMKELALLREASNSIDFILDEATSLAVAPEAEQILASDSKERSIEDLRDTISSLRIMIENRCSAVASAKQDTDSAQGNFNQIISPQEASAKTSARPVPPAKRDNIKKEQSDQFPARRHYEAEGRANEDPDVPATVPVPSPLPESNPWTSAAKIQRKKRELAKTKQELQIMHALMDTIKDAQQAGQNVTLPADYFRIFAACGKDDEFDDNDTMTDNEDSQENRDSDSAGEGETPPIPDALFSVIRESTNEPSHIPRSDDKNRSDMNEQSEMESQSVERAKNEREMLMRLQEQFVLLEHKLSSPKQQNNEPMRSSGEGGTSSQKKKPRTGQTVMPVGNELSNKRSKQENLLTRQNVATVESQNQNNNSGMAKGRNTGLKKDNVNDLSSKVIKPTFLGPPRTSLDSNFNVDGVCSFATDLNQSLSLRHHLQQQKSVYEEFIKHDRNKPQNYSRNRDHLAHSNSSVNSEALDGSSSALAPDTTAAATWGGSSTQENFEDENEANESLEEEDEGDARVEPIREKHLTTTHAKASSAQQFSGDQQYGNISVDSSVKRRDNRLQKYFKSTQLNQWVEKKNFTKLAPSSQSTEPSLEPTNPDENADQAEAFGNCNTGSPMSTSFVHELQQQLDKLNALCRPMLQEPHPLFRCQTQLPQMPNLQTGDGETQPGFNQPVHNPCRSSFSMSEVMHSSLQHFQLQQQLLSCLGQCYHMLYMQQLEIQHLHRCLQNQDAESSNQTVSNSEDFVFRPWCLFPPLNLNQPMPMAPSQPSPMATTPFLPPNPPNFTFNPPMGASNVSTPYAMVTGTQPARAVVHPAGLETRQNSETLNNQVPPRTRANNFLDNFRSYSRQNLLSTSNVAKSKDSGLSGGPQVRQVHPLVSNESSWGHRSRVIIPPHVENNSIVQPPERTSIRPVANADIPDSSSRSKRPNLSKSLVANQVIPDVAAASPMFSLCPETDQPVRQFDNDSLQTESQKVSTEAQSNSPSILQVKCKTNVSSSSEPIPEAIYSEFSQLLCQNSYRPGYLELLRELRNLKSDSLQRALQAVRELISNEDANGLQSDNLESESSQRINREEPDRPSENDGSSTLSAATNDVITSKTVSESVGQRSSTQNWAPATIIPLGNFTTLKQSTGAVRKRPLRDSPFTVPATQEPIVEPKTDTLEGLVDSIVMESIPCTRANSADDCCSSLGPNFCSRIIEMLRSHMRVTPEFQSQLQQTLHQVMSKYSGLKWSDCEADLLKNVTRILYRELALYRSTSFRAALEEACERSSSLKRNTKPDILQSASKPFTEKKLPVSNKDSQEPAIRHGSFSASYTTNEAESSVGELYINMPEDSNMCSHYNGNVLNSTGRNSLSSLVSPPNNNGSLQAINAEEDMAYEFEMDADAEREVEACTEADLAEADQSPGRQQQQASNADEWHATHTYLLRRPSASAEDNFQESYNNTESSGASAFGFSTQNSVSSSGEKEIALDDIPTKLTPLSQEELQRQMSQEQAANTLLLEVVQELPLVGDGENLKDPQTFV